MFPDDDACLSYLFTLSHGESPVCPKCSSEGAYKRVQNRKSYQCGKCSNQIYPMKGTIYEKSRTPLLVWFEIMFLFIKSKNGISAMEVQRITGVTYKTAYRMLMHIRKAVAVEHQRETGVFEVDETFVGGLNKNRHADKKVKHSQGRSFKDKTPVFGMFDRNTKEVRAFVVPDTSRSSLRPLLFSNATKGSSVMSDEWHGYGGIGRYYKHDVVDHKAKEYVRGDITTNRIENFWSHLKRTFKGSYITVSRKHMQRYVDEVVFRFNNRENPLIFFDLLQFSSWTLSSPVPRTLRA